MASIPKRSTNEKLSVDNILGRFRGVTGAGKEWMAQCPAHNDRNPSLKLTLGEDGKLLLHCHAGCRTQKVLSSVGLGMRDLFDVQPSQICDYGHCKSISRTYKTLEAAIKAMEKSLGLCVEQWQYACDTGDENFCVARFEGGGGAKQYRPFHRDSKGWRLGDPAGPLHLYRFPELAQTDRVLVVEGEKCADHLAILGFTATTSAHGACAAKRTDWTPLCGKPIAIIPDNDDAGRRYADDVVKILRELDSAARIKIVAIPGLNEGEDVVDFVNARKDRSNDEIRAEIDAIIDATLELNPSVIIDVDDVPVFRGVSPDGKCSPSIRRVIDEVREIVIKSKRVFRYAHGVYLTIASDGEDRLICICDGHSVTSYAPSLLAGIFRCKAQAKGKGKPKIIQFAPPLAFIGLLLNDEQTRKRLPLVKTYARRAIYDETFTLRRPGWHDDCGILVHGPAITPVQFTPADPSKPILERLPPHLHELLRDFPFRRTADLVNFLALLLTGLLAPAFVLAGKAIGLIDGNQPSVGKSLLIRCLGIILDGSEPSIIGYTADDEELVKRVCATLRSSEQTIVPIDNARIPASSSISSTGVEAFSVAPEISMRVLGKSENLRRPNDVLWTLTMNGTRASTEALQRFFNALSNKSAPTIPSNNARDRQIATAERELRHWGL